MPSSPQAIIGINFERFEKEFSKLESLFRNQGFYKNADKFEIDVFGRFIDYDSQVVIITSRLEDEIALHESFMKYILTRLKEERKIDDNELKEYGQYLPKLMLDLSDFYIYTRIFLDTLTVCIRLSFRNAGYQNWNIIERSINFLLNENKMQICKSKIDLQFFEGLEKKLAWISDFKESRDGLFHKFYHFVFTTTRRGDLGYDIMD
jgi:hypothetical protein